MQNNVAILRFITICFDGVIHVESLRFSDADFPLELFTERRTERERERELDNDSTFAGFGFFVGLTDAECFNVD